MSDAHGVERMFATIGKALGPLDSYMGLLKW
jgi:hypothetical protein